MNSSIEFTTLHIHAGHDVDSHTLSKTTAVYHHDHFDYDKKINYQSFTEVRIVVKEKVEKAEGINSELYQYFEWNLN